MEIERQSVNDILKLLNCFRQKERNCLITQRPSNIKYINMSDSFELKNNQKKYNLQYWEIYQKRLAQIKEYFDDFTQHGAYKCSRILDIKVGEPHFLVVTIFKQMKDKQYSFRGKLPKDSNDDLINKEDQIFIEDSSGRMQLALNNTQYINSLGLEIEIDINNLVTGIILGIRGIQRAAEVNVFEADRVFACDLPQQLKILNLPPPYSQNKRDIHQNFKDLSYYLSNPFKANFLLISSGLSVEPQGNEELKLKTLKNLLFGHSSCKQLLRRVSRVIIAGNLLKPNSGLDLNWVNSYMMREEANQAYKYISNCMREADNHIHQIATDVSCDIMPGETDPCNLFWPQQPLSKCYFSSCISDKNCQLQLVSNPYRFEFQGVDILGTSGMNVLDQQKHSVQNDVTSILESHLMMRHIAPTSPDSLPCFPFSESDPFIINDLPHIYFAGNTQKFETKLIYEPQTKKRCRIVSVPHLQSTGCFVLINLNNLDTFAIQL